jgi:hypothetical protein
MLRLIRRVGLLDAIRDLLVVNHTPGFDFSGFLTLMKVSLFRSGLTVSGPSGLPHQESPGPGRITPRKFEWSQIAEVKRKDSATAAERIEQPERTVTLLQRGYLPLPLLFAFPSPRMAHADR